MPRGSTHGKATAALAAAGGLVAYSLGCTAVQSFALSGGALAGLVLTPDLDIDRGCISNAYLRRLAGKPVERLWALFWLPYACMLPHRSNLSHLPLVGTALRLAYLALLPALWSALAARPFALPVVFPAWALWAAAGLVLADTLHYLMDRFMRS